VWSYDHPLPSWSVLSADRLHEVVALTFNLFPFNSCHEWLIMCPSVAQSLETYGYSFLSSHARTVVRECCKDDDESQCERENLTPASKKPLNRWSPKFVVTASVISTIMQNFIQIGLGVLVLRMRDFAPLGTKWFCYFWGSWERLPPRRAHRLWRKLRQTTRFRARKCLLGVAKPISKVKRL